MKKKIKKPKCKPMSTADKIKLATFASKVNP